MLVGYRGRIFSLNNTFDEKPKVRYQLDKWLKDIRPLSCKISIQLNSAVLLLDGYLSYGVLFIVSSALYDQSGSPNPVFSLGEEEEEWY